MTDIELQLSFSDQFDGFLDAIFTYVKLGLGKPKTTAQVPENHPVAQTSGMRTSKLDKAMDKAKIPPMVSLTASGIDLRNKSFQVMQQNMKRDL